MAEMLQKHNSSYFYYFFSFLLGYICISASFILFNQTLAFIGVSPKISITLLSVIFSGLIIGFLLAIRFGKILQHYLKFILLLTVLWLGCFSSTLFLGLLQKFFSADLVFISFAIISPFVLFGILGYLIASLFIENITTQINYLIMLALGLLVGTLITEIIIFNFLGISWAIFFNCCLLLWCVITSMENFFLEIITTSLVVALIVIIFGINIHSSQYSIFYNEYHAIDNQKFIAVAPTQSIIASLTEKLVTPTHNKYPYLPLLKKIIYEDLNLANKNVLVLGDGGYQLGNTDKNNIHFTYLTFTSNQLPSACTYLDIVAKGDRILAAGENQIGKSGQLYSAIISNIFPNDFTIPEVLLSYQHMLEIRNALPSEGIAIFNVVARPTLSDLYSKRVDNTIRAVFPSCMEIPLVYGKEPTNIIYVCHKSNGDKNNSIYTSNLSAANLNLFGLYQEENSHGII